MRHPLLWTVMSLSILSVQESSAQLWHKGGVGIGVHFGYEFGATREFLVGFHAGYFQRGENFIAGGLVEASFFLQTGRREYSLAGEIRTVRSSSPQSYGGRIGIISRNQPGTGFRITTFVGTSVAAYASISFLPPGDLGYQIGAFARATDDLSGILQF